MKLKFMKLIKIIWERTDLYWNYLHDIKEDSSKIVKIKKDLIELTYISIFAFTLLFFNYFIVSIQKIEEVEGTAFIFFATVIIYLFWVFVVLHTKKTHKHQIREAHNQEGKLQQEHE